MSESVREAMSVTDHARASGSDSKQRVSEMAAGLVGSEILKIAAEIRGLVAAGKTICDLTVGDFSPKQFPIPASFLSGIREALERGETNYPPSNGLLELRQAVQRFYVRELGLDYPVESVLIAGGSRPVIYAVYRALCDPGDRVVYPAPSWNNNHYVHMLGAVGHPIVCGPADRFMPTRDALRGTLAGARLLCLNSPLNPAGTAISREALRGISEMVLEENDVRATRGERPLYLMYDQVYWMLCFGDTQHVTPPGLLPEMARYTVFVDGISKAFAATGVRVGWAVGPTDVVARMSSILGHVGAWAPRAEQAATAVLLDDPAAIRAFHATFKRGVQARLELLHQGVQRLKLAGLPLESIPPMGAIYLTVRIHPFGRHTPEGALLATNEDVRRFVLAAAGIGIVPFQAFGAAGDDGWFRLSVGAVSQQDVADALPRLERALRSLV
jgi:aspartate aminotransferase